MANMSYCRFRNTRLDLRDCVDEMEQHGFLEDMDLSGEEQHAMNAMYLLCKRFTASFEQLTANDTDDDDAEEVERLKDEKNGVYPDKFDIAN